MSVRARRRGREEAFKLLFQADQGVSTWDEMIAIERLQNDTPPAAWAFAEELAGGVWQHLAEVDGWLDKLAHGWSVERMAAADRAILRLAVFELTHDSDTPLSVAINEAVELAKKYGTDDSPRFINGILGAVARQTDGALTPAADSDPASLTEAADSDEPAETQEIDSERLGTGEQS